MNSQKLIFLDTTEGVATSIRPYWSEATKDRASVVQAVPDMLEIVPPGTSKGSGVRMLLSHLGVPAKEVCSYCQHILSQSNCQQIIFHCILLFALYHHTNSINYFSRNSFLNDILTTYEALMVVAPCRCGNLDESNKKKKVGYEWLWLSGRKSNVKYVVLLWII